MVSPIGYDIVRQHNKTPKKSLDTAGIPNKIKHITLYTCKLYNCILVNNNKPPAPSNVST